MFQIIGAMAEFERSLIQERVRAGLRNAKLKGKNAGKAASDSEQRRNDSAARGGCELSRDCKGRRHVPWHGAHPPFARVMRIWVGFAVLVRTPVFVGTVVDMATGGHYTSSDNWVGLVVPPTLVLFGTVLPKVGRLFGKSDRRFILEHIQNTLAARIEGPESAK